MAIGCQSESAAALPLHGCSAVRPHLVATLAGRVHSPPTPKLRRPRRTGQSMLVPMPSHLEVRISTGAIAFGLAGKTCALATPTWSEAMAAPTTTWTGKLLFPRHQSRN